MSTLAASTPSPPPYIHTPPTPKHGYDDSWEPFSPRKSARLSSQQQSLPARTPSPKNSTPQSHNHHLRSPQSARHNYNDTMTSPVPSPSKKKMPPVNRNRATSGQLTADSAVSAAASLGLPAKMETRSGRTNISSHGGMLPTPAKTPSRKHPSAENEANIAAIARNLFHTDAEVIPDAKKKRAKKYIGLSMDSFTAVDDEEPIKIFTDSHDRVPEVDHSADNPFYGQGTARPPEPVKRRSRRNQVSIPGEGKESIEEAARREDGLVYVFRGKKIFRKFEDDGDTAAGETDTPGSTARGKRITRSSIQPKLLFPPSSTHAAVDEDEEAETDIEDQTETKQTEEKEDEAPETPVDAADDVPSTPNAPRFAPASPPTTVRATRSSNKAADNLTPMKPGRGGKRSPFDGWRHTKSGSGGGS